MARRQPEAGRWTARPKLAMAVRALVLLVPVTLALATALLTALLLPMGASLDAQVWWWTAVLGSSAACLLLTDRLARRALPLAVLLELSLVFPDRAPSRLRAARTGSVAEVERTVDRLRRQGTEGPAIDAAETLVVLVGMLGLHDKRTRGHSERVRALTDLLTLELGLSEDDRAKVRWAALVHDLGKLRVPVSVLNGGKDLAAEEWEALRRHPEEGQRLAGGFVSWLGEWGRTIAEHHERWDGTGYPAGLSGESIGYGARIVAVADSFEVMTAARSYAPARSAAAARAELARCAGTQFDPAVVRAFLGISVGRLAWVLGPLTWAVQVPVVATLDKAGQAVKVAAVSALAVGLLGTGLVVPDLAPWQTPDAGVSVESQAPAAGSGAGRGAAGALPADTGSALAAGFGRGAEAGTAGTAAAASAADPAATAAGQGAVGDAPQAAAPVPRPAPGQPQSVAAPGPSPGAAPAPAPAPAAAPAPAPPVSDAAGPARPAAPADPGEPGGGAQPPDPTEPAEPARHDHEDHDDDDRDDDHDHDHDHDDDG